MASTEQKSCCGSKMSISTVNPQGLALGDPFDTRGAAAQNALNYINPRSISENIEYAGVIYQDPANGLYYAFPPIPIGRSGNEHVPLNFPAGMTPVGDYHSHGNYCDSFSRPTNRNNDVTGADEFSVEDRKFARRIIRQFPGWMRYLGTPSGRFLQYTSGSAPTTLDPSR